MDTPVYAADARVGGPVQSGLDALRPDLRAGGGGGRMFVAFNDSDKVVALDVETGRELWAFYTDGPVRLPPAAWQGRVYFASDDGCLYCVEAASGRLTWRFRGGPSARKVLGNRRLISAWPARADPCSVTVASILQPASGRLWERFSTPWMPRPASRYG